MPPGFVFVTMARRPADFFGWNLLLHRKPAACPAEHNHSQNIPNRLGAWTMELYSSVAARGVNQPVYEGVCLTGFDADFDGTGALRGNYELVLAGLNSQTSVWNHSRLNLYFDSSGTADPYLVGKLLITDRRHGEVVVTPGGRSTKDLRYCFGYVTLRFHAPTGTRFFQPEASVEGSFTETDYWEPRLIARCRQVPVPRWARR